MRNKKLHKLKEKININGRTSFKMDYVCPIEWEQMEKLSAEDRVRFCHDCKLKVYDMLGLDSSALWELMKENDQRICGQVYIRKDNKVVFSKKSLEDEEAEVLRGMLIPDDE